jgi:hypothetical protein
VALVQAGWATTGETREISDSISKEQIRRFETRDQAGSLSSYLWPGLVMLFMYERQFPQVMGSAKAVRAVVCEG